MKVEIKNDEEAISVMEDALNTIRNTQLSGKFKDTYTLLSAIGKFKRDKAWHIKNSFDEGSAKWFCENFHFALFFMLTYKGIIV